MMSCIVMEWVLKLLLQQVSEWAVIFVVSAFKLLIWDVISILE